jgi:hypothetical protein
MKAIILILGPNTPTTTILRCNVRLPPYLIFLSYIYITANSIQNPLVSNSIIHKNITVNLNQYQVSCRSLKIMAPRTFTVIKCRFITLHQGFQYFETKVTDPIHHTQQFNLDYSNITTDYKMWLLLPCWQLHKN